MSQTMYGVVLWADHTDQKAVIWCEDHGDLALYHDTEASVHDGVSLDEGDLIEFDLKQEENLRLAHNPRRLAQNHYPGLAQALRHADASRNTGPTVPNETGNVIPFRGRNASSSRGAIPAIHAG
ncbi:hypothetical protein KUV62_12490 [Salipiger bermudensis]|uniref:hypothetical protein n=1 Tax=Salipiger bermudensis TaxID=344736 RepID=UPI001C99AF34|nr:hypothetical protein [Salipiger bermudensis]MBY6004734.1 hypothetical protein [Salipiger bermudensis]